MKTNVSTPLHKRNGNTSVGRILSLFRMEVTTGGRSIILSVFLTIAAIITFYELMNLLIDGPYPLPISLYTLLSLTGSYFFFFSLFLINKRVHRSNTVSSPILPMRTWEKLLVFWLYIIGAMILAYGVVWAAVGIEILLHPNIELHRLHIFEFYNGSSIFLFASTTVWSSSIGLFCAIRYRRVIACMSGYIGITLLMLWSSILITINFSPINELVAPVVLAIGLCFLGLSYLALNRKQL